MTETLVHVQLWLIKPLLTRSLPVTRSRAVTIYDLAAYAVLVVDVENLEVSAEPDA